MGVKRAVSGANTRNFEAQNGILAADMAFHRVGTFIECITRVPTVLNANLAVLAGIGEIRWKKLGRFPKRGAKMGAKIAILWPKTGVFWMKIYFKKPAEYLFLC